MSNQYNIRWRKSDYAKLSHLVRKVNKKVFEIEVKRPDISDYQPQMLDYQELKGSIKTRHDLNIILNRYNRYLREGVEEVEKSTRGAVASKWQVNEFKIAQRAENVRRANLRKKMETQEVTIGNKGTGVTRAQMGKVLDNATKPSKKNFDNMDAGSWKHAFQLFERKMFNSYEGMFEHYHIRNYVKGLVAEGYSDELINIMQHISPKEFERVFYTDETATYDFIYDPIELKAKQGRLIELWREHVDPSVNNKIDVGVIVEEVQAEYENGERIKGSGRIKQTRKRKRKRK